MYTYIMVVLQGCSRDWLQTAAARARCVLLPAGELLQHAADIGRDIFVLQKVSMSGIIRFYSFGFLLFNT